MKSGSYTFLCLTDLLIENEESKTEIQLHGQNLTKERFRMCLKEL